MKCLKPILCGVTLTVLLLLFTAPLFAQEETQESQPEGYSLTQSKRFLDRCNLNLNFGIGGLSIKPLKHYDIGWTNQSPPQVDLQGFFGVKMKSFQSYGKLKLGLYKIGPMKSGDEYIDEKSILFKVGPGINYSQKLSEGITFRPFLEANFLSLSGLKKEKDEATKVVSTEFDTSHSDFRPEFGASLLFSENFDVTYSFRPGERKFHFISLSHSPSLKNSLTPKVYYELVMGDEIKAFYAGVSWPAALSSADKAKDYGLSKSLLKKKGFLSEAFYYVYMGEVLTYTLASFLGLVIMGTSGL